MSGQGSSKRATLFRHSSCALSEAGAGNINRLRMTNQLYYGDNLVVLRESIASESVDLVYLDPPFNSSASYNILFRALSGEQSQAQIEAFEDSWHWNIQ